jgi:glycosyltransferase involved in cell wall biosynthesis
MADLPEVASHALVSIIVTSCRTPDQTKLCLRSLRRHTDSPHEVIVVDNGSGEGEPSLAWLRSLRWIRLIESPLAEKTHKSALDLGVAAARGEWILALHSDAYVQRRGWLRELVAFAAPDARIVASQDRVLLPAVGLLGRLHAWIKRRRLARLWAGRGTPKLVSHCALFHRSLFAERGLRFDVPDVVDGVRLDCAEPIQRHCEAHGIPIRWLDRAALAPLVWHFEGATVNVVTRRALAWQRRLRAWRFWRRAEVRALLEDRALDA